MPRYDDRYGNTRLYVGHLSSRTRSRDLDRLFSRYGRVRDVDMKRDYAFVDFSDPRDADDARYHLDGRDFDGSRLIVELSRGVPRGSRESVARGPPPGSGRCFNCGVDGHWARDCTAGDWKNKCYRCGERGHIERNCKNSPKKLSSKRGGSYSRSPVRSRYSRSPVRSRYSRSPVRSRSPRRGRSRSRSYSRGRSYSRSRSPVPRDRSREPSERDRSPEPMNDSPPPKGRGGSLSPEDRSPRERGSLSPEDRSARERGSLSPEDRSARERASLSPKDRKQDESDYGGSPKENGRSLSPDGRRESPAEANGHGRSPSPSPREDRSPVEEDYEDTRHRSPKGSESP